MDTVIPPFFGIANVHTSATQRSSQEVSDRVDGFIDKIREEQRTLAEVRKPADILLVSFHFIQLRVRVGLNVAAIGLPWSLPSLLCEEMDWTPGGPPHFNRNGPRSCGDSGVSQR